MGFMTAILGAAAAANSASSAVASETMQASEEATKFAAESGFASRAQEAAAAQMADDSMDIKNAVLNNNNEPKNFFSRAWDESKQSVGIGNGADMGKVGYNLGKMAVSKGDSSEPPKMDQAPVQTSAPSAPVANAEDELNKLRNRMNVS